MINVNFYTKDFRKKKDGTVPVYVRLNLNGERKDLSIKSSVPLDIWDSEAQKAKGQSKEAKTLNNQINFLRGRILQIYQDLSVRGDVNLDLVKNTLQGKTPKPKTTSVIDVFDEHNDRFEEKVEVGAKAKGSWVKYNTIRNHIYEFLDANYNVELSVDKIDAKFIHDFHHFLRTSQKISHNTTVKYVRGLGKILRIAKRDGHMKTSPMEFYDETTKKTKPTFLTIDELQKWEAYEPPTETLEVINDLFIFGCYTGLAYSDVRSLTMDHFVSVTPGRYTIDKDRIKTEVQANIPLFPKAHELVEKYQAKRIIKNTNKVFPVPSNAKVNEYLKVIAASVGITKKNITFHVSRHTFATTVILYHDPSAVKTLSGMMGHSSVSMTEHYAKLADKAAEDLIDRIQVMMNLEQGKSPIAHYLERMTLEELIEAKTLIEDRINSLQPEPSAQAS